MNRLAITNISIKNKNYISYIALDQNRNFIDFNLYPQEQTLLNNIYIARIDKILPNIQAVFVKISESQKCFLPFSEISNAFFTKKQSTTKDFCEGDELFVQITKDAVKTKDPVASCSLTLSGSYCVLTTKNTGLNVSQKLPEELRITYKQLLTDLCSDHLEYNYGIVLRTNCQNATIEQLKEDIIQIKKSFIEMLEKGKHLSIYSNVYKALPEYIRRLQTERDFFKNFDEIITDSVEIIEEVKRYLPYFASKESIKLYIDSKVSLKTLYNIEGNIQKLLANKVWLPSGANIIIEQLETMTVIDVNSSKNVKFQHKHGVDDVIYSINVEAATEIAKQLRLRNISGMIIIDFINMSSNEDAQNLIKHLSNEIKQDIVPCQFIDITKLGLVELTRKKTQKSLKEIIDVE